jgi:hypothetical protein
MQIRLTQRNEKEARKLIRIYKQTCREYDLSVTKQLNLLIAGRLGLAIEEAEKELAEHKCKHACRP